MKFQSKKDPTVVATLFSSDEKYGTVIMEYVTGSEKGKSFSITSSTLKRWWKKIEDDESTSESLVDNIDYDKVNEPYKPDVKPHYIPKPKSVIEYETKRGKKYNSELPEFEALVEDFAEYCTKINNNSKYIKFNDKSTLWRKCGVIDVYASETLWQALTEKGLQSKPNKDKDRPFGFKINTMEDYNKVLEAVKGE